ncbi:hypothetical protein FRACA_170020 [Frankia canadensis]|uniref:Uncharacterized protein n=1 Tax=Frankia canadensis TaxID=1836972 RepID=A0A2I2KN19_9ACTN|nr:hypothetical protein FRACA_170020 [Frankia canadensis]SOU54350.1 hypothetical protein FRACA_170020 [Frankia canadensis]
MPVSVTTGYHRRGGRRRGTGCVRPAARGFTGGGGVRLVAGTAGRTGRPVGFGGAGRGLLVAGFSGGFGVVFAGVVVLVEVAGFGFAVAAVLVLVVRGGVGFGLPAATTGRRAGTPRPADAARAARTRARALATRCRRWAASLPRSSRARSARRATFNASSSPRTPATSSPRRTACSDVAKARLNAPSRSAAMSGRLAGVGLVIVGSSLLFRRRGPAFPGLRGALLR